MNSSLTNTVFLMVSCNEPCWKVLPKISTGAEEFMLMFSLVRPEWDVSIITCEHTLTNVVKRECVPARQANTHTHTRAHRTKNLFAGCVESIRGQQAEQRHSYLWVYQDNWSAIGLLERSKQRDCIIIDLQSIKSSFNH